MFDKLANLKTYRSESLSVSSSELELWRCSPGGSLGRKQSYTDIMLGFFQRSADRTSSDICGATLLDSKPTYNITDLAEESQKVMPCEASSPGSVDQRQSKCDWLHRVS